MITDEQVNAFINSFELNGGHFLGNNEFDNVRKALEAYEQSKWVKFDIDDTLTHPRDNKTCAVVYHTGRVSTDRWSDLHRFWVYASCQKCITYWQQLPEFTES